MASCTMMGSRSRLRRTRPSVSRSAIRSLARPMPSTSSSEPRHTGKKLCGASISWPRMVSASSSMLIHDTSVRGVMMERMERSASVSTPLTMLRSSTPKAGMAGALALGRSGSSAGGRLPSMRSTAAAVRSRMGRRASNLSRLRRASWFSASIATEKPMAAYR